MEEDISIFPERSVAYATFWQRFAALLIDSVILAIPGFVINRALGARGLFEEMLQHELSSPTILAEIISIVIGWLYFALMEASTSQATVGKQAMSLKVTDTAGNRISFARATGRHFAKNLSVIIVFIGYFMMLWDERAQTLHDKLAGTLVVKR